MKLFDTNAKQVRGERWAKGALALSMLLSSLGVSIVNAALPTLTTVFGASFSEVQWIVLAYLLVITIVIVSVGRLGDLLGRRRMLLGGIILFTTASLLCGFAPTLHLLIATRALQGLGGAISIALSVALVSETVPKERVGSTMGLLGTMSAVGTALGPSLSGVLIGGLNWRAIFLIMVPMGVLNFFLAYRYLPICSQKAMMNQGSFDGLGTLLLGLTLALYSFAMTAKGGSFNGQHLFLLLAAIIMGCLFMFVEKKSLSPLIRLTVLRDGVLRGSLVMNAIVSTVMMSTLVIGPLYLSRSLGLNQTFVGLVMSIGPCMSILSGVPAGHFVDRMGASGVAIMGLFQMGVGTASLTVLPTLFGIYGYVISVVILSPGYQMFLAANSTSILTGVASDQRGVISGLLNLSRNLGLVTGASAMGAVFSIASHSTQFTKAHPDAVASGMQVTFAVATILTLIALCIAVKNRAQIKERVGPQRLVVQ